MPSINFNRSSENDLVWNPNTNSYEPASEPVSEGVLLDGNGNVLLRNGSALILGSSSSSADWGETLQGDVYTDATFICAPYKCTGNQMITSFSAPNATSVALSYAFKGCQNLEEVDLNNVEHVDANALEQCFYGCTSLTTAPTLSNVTTIGTSGLTSCFRSTSLTTAPTFASLTTVEDYGLASCFYECTSLTTAPTFASLTTIGQNGLNGCFRSTSLTTAPTFASLTTVEDYGLQYCFYGCTSLQNISFPSLTTIGQGGLNSCFYGCTSLQSISFPSLTAQSFGSYTNQFNSLLYNTGTSVTHTLHFPSNLESTIQGLSGYPTFGGTSGYVVLAFDLPATS